MYLAIEPSHLLVHGPFSSRQRVAYHVYKASPGFAEWDRQAWHRQHISSVGATKNTCTFVDSTIVDLLMRFEQAKHCMYLQMLDTGSCLPVYDVTGLFILPLRQREGSTTVKVR